MNVYERDNKMSDIASIAAEAFAEKYDPATNEREIKIAPRDYLKYTIPYLQSAHFIAKRKLSTGKKRLSTGKKRLSKIWKRIHDGLNGSR